MDEQLTTLVTEAVQAYRSELYEWPSDPAVRATRCRERLTQMIELNAPATIIETELKMLNRLVLLMREHRTGVRLQ